MLAGDLRNARSAQLGGPNAASGPCIGRAHARVLPSRRPPSAQSVQSGPNTPKRFVWFLLHLPGKGNRPLKYAERNTAPPPGAAQREMVGPL